VSCFVFLFFIPSSIIIAKYLFVNMLLVMFIMVSIICRSITWKLRVVIRNLVVLLKLSFLCSSSDAFAFIHRIRTSVRIILSPAYFLTFADTWVSCPMALGLPIPGRRGHDHEHAATFRAGSKRSNKAPRSTLSALVPVARPFPTKLQEEKNSGCLWFFFFFFLLSPDATSHCVE